MSPPAGEAAQPASAASGVGISSRAGVSACKRRRAGVQAAIADAASPPAMQRCWCGQACGASPAAPGAGKQAAAPTYRDGRVHALHVGLLNQDLHRPLAQLLDVALLERLAALELQAGQRQAGGAVGGCGQQAAAGGRRVAAAAVLARPLASAPSLGFSHLLYPFVQIHSGCGRAPAGARAVGQARCGRPAAWGGRGLPETRCGSAESAPGSQALLGEALMGCGCWWFLCRGQRVT